MRILLATDGSTPATRARDLITALPWPRDTRFRVISVVPRAAELINRLTVGPSSPAAVEPVEDEVVRLHVVALDDAERTLRLARPGATVERDLLRGRPATVIVDEARGFRADLVVVGHRGHGPFDTMLLGSVSAEVVDHAPCPVLVARSDAIGSVVLAEDGSGGAMTAEQTLAHLPIDRRTPITVLSVVESGLPFTAATAPGMFDVGMTAYIEGIEEARRDALGVAEAAAVRLRAAGFHARTAVHDGDPSHQIVDYARTHGTGLLVLGTRGHTGLRRLLLGSVARNVLLHAPCSVLIVRETAPPSGDTAEREARERAGAAVG